MLFALIFPRAERASTFHISAERNVWLQSALRSFAIVCDYMETALFAIVCDPRSSAIRLRSYGNQPLETRLNSASFCQQGAHLINKIIHGCLAMWNFSSPVQLDIPLVRCVHSWDVELNTRREILHLRAPMYYSLRILCQYASSGTVWNKTRLWQEPISWSMQLPY